MSITATLDGPTLIALATVVQPLTVNEIAHRASRGSEIGIRRALVRLVDEGIVSAVKIGKTTVYNLNRDHVAASVVLEMSRLRAELWRRLSVEISSWRVTPAYACVFGSAARRDGDESSDIDILLVRAPTQDEIGENSRRAMKAKQMRGLAEGVSSALSHTPPSAAAHHRWDASVDRLRDLVPKWTGNRAHIVELTTLEWNRERKARSEFAVNVENDAVRIFEELVPLAFRYHKDALS
jgi:hypothetical protein